MKQTRQVQRLHQCTYADSICPCRDTSFSCYVQAFFQILLFNGDESTLQCKLYSTIQMSIGKQQTTQDKVYSLSVLMGI